MTERSHRPVGRRDRRSVGAQPERQSTPFQSLNMINHKEKSLLDRVGNKFPLGVRRRRRPLRAIGVIVVCGLWWIVGLPTDI